MNDYCLLEIDEWTEQHEAQKRALQEETSLLTKLEESELKASEYPDP